MSCGSPGRRSRRRRSSSIACPRGARASTSKAGWSRAEMASPSSGRTLHSIGNKMLAVLVAVAVLPAVAVSIYALRKSSEVLSSHELTLTSEACVTDAREIEDRLDDVHQSLRIFVKENPDLRLLLENLMPATKEGETSPVGDRWRAIERDAKKVDETLGSLLARHPSCQLAYVVSSGFHVEGGTPVVWRERHTTIVGRERDAELASKPLLSIDEQ